jgi:hypothetical protein
VIDDEVDLLLARFMEGDAAICTALLVLAAI